MKKISYVVLVVLISFFMSCCKKKETLIGNESVVIPHSTLRNVPSCVILDIGGCEYVWCVRDSGAAGVGGLASTAGCIPQNTIVKVIK
jgi:hypothetical protein